MPARFSPKAKMADIIDVNYHLLGILPRLGVRMGFGESSVDEACRRDGVDVTTFLLVSSVYTFGDSAPTAAEIAKVSAPDLLRYLRASHEYYLTTALVALSDALTKALAPCEEKLKAVVRRFFGDYKAELEKHFSFEEEHVFPYVEALLQGEAPARHLSTPGDDHTNIEEKIGDLKAIVLKYLPGECDNEDVAGVFSTIYALAEDLKCHSRVEDTILLPLIANLEGREEHRQEREELSSREKEILVAVARGRLNKEIADEFNISINTVITHRKNITRKTGIKTVSGLTVYAILNNLIDINSIED